MNEEIAISPEAIQKKRDVHDLIYQFGPYSGRFVCKYPKNWLSQVIDTIKCLPDIEQHYCKELLNKNKWQFIRAGREFWSELGWMGSVEKIQKSPSPFDHVFGPSGTSCPFINYENIGEVIEHISRSVNIEGTAENYRKAASTLLCNSPQIVLIDPYFEPGAQRCINTLNAFLEEINGPYGTKRCELISIIAKPQRNYTKEEFDKSICNFKKIVDWQNFPSRGVRILMIDTIKSPGMHYRFLLSALGAIKFDHGFAVTSEKNLISYEDKRTHNELMDNFLDALNDLDGFREKGYVVLHDHTIDRSECNI